MVVFECELFLILSAVKLFGYKKTGTWPVSSILFAGNLNNY